jgi:hypothetical protein
VAVVELKSVGRPYRAGNLDRLWAYTHTVCAGDPALLEQRRELCAVLVVPCRTPALDLDVQRMGLAWAPKSPGYWQVTGGMFALHVVEIDVVAEQEDDDVLRLFGHGRPRTVEARRFLTKQAGSKEAEMAVQELEGYDEVMQKLLETLSPEQRVAGLAPEQRVAGLAPEQRVAGLTPEQILLTLPDAVLRSLSEEYIATLSQPAQDAIRARRAK